MIVRQHVLAAHQAAVEEAQRRGHQHDQRGGDQNPAGIAGVDLWHAFPSSLPFWDSSARGLRRGRCGAWASLRAVANRVPVAGEYRPRLADRPPVSPAGPPVPAQAACYPECTGGAVPCHQANWPNRGCGYCANCTSPLRRRAPTGGAPPPEKRPLSAEGREGLDRRPEGVVPVAPLQLGRGQGQAVADQAPGRRRRQHGRHQRLRWPAPGRPARRRREGGGGGQGGRRRGRRGSRRARSATPGRRPPP